MPQNLRAVHEDARVRFWRDEADWYRDSNEFVFLARAVHMVGKAYYGAEWTGEEPGIPWHPPIPEQAIYCGQTDWDYALRLLHVHQPDYRNRAIASGELFLPLPTQDEYAAAHRLSAVIAEATQPAFDRFVGVMTQLINLFEAGTLPTGARAVEGGVITSIHPSFWNGESVGTRFRCCRIHPANPFTWETVEEGGLLIFVERAALDLYLQRLAKPQQTVTTQPAQSPALAKVEVAASTEAPCDTGLPARPARKRSPYFELMAQVQDELGFDCHDASLKKATIIERLQARWPSDLPHLSGTMAKHLATALRSPAVQAGGAKKSAPRKRSNR